MPNFRNVQRKRQVQAYKVTCKDGEDLQTLDGFTHVNKGDYVLRSRNTSADDWIYHSLDADNYNRTYRNTPPKKR